MNLNEFQVVYSQFQQLVNQFSTRCKFLTFFVSLLLICLNSSTPIVIYTLLSVPIVPCPLFFQYLVLCLCLLVVHTFLYWSFYISFWSRIHYISGHLTIYVLWAKLAPLHMSPATWLQSTRHDPLPPPPWLILKAKPTYAQVTKKPPYDPEKGACDPGIQAHNKSCDRTGSKLSHDQSRDKPHDQTGSKLSRDPTRDPGKEPPDQPRDWSAIRSCALPRFGCTTRPLIGMWKTMGTINDSQRINKSCFHCTN